MMFFFKQKTADEMLISDWSSDVCSSDLDRLLHGPQIGFGIILAENVIKAALRQTHVQRHLSAFKAVDADAGTRLRALLSATSSLALARADAPPDPHAALASSSIISEFV